MKFVADRRGTGAGSTVTGMEQAADWVAASDAVQDTVVVPTPKLAPDTGVHEVVTGAFPPATTGAG
ncbi:MAG TPA: hypothetical protein VF921_15685 [Vicinamibacterales bacterium]